MTLAIKKGNKNYLFYSTDIFVEYSTKKYILFICNKKFKISKKIYEYIAMLDSFADTKNLFIDIDKDYCMFEDKLK